MRFRTLFATIGVSAALWPSTSYPVAVNANSVNSSVVGTIIHDTWDPEDPLTISGTVWAGAAPCDLDGIVANADSVIVIITPPANPGTTGNGQRFCGSAPIRRRAFAPGTNSSGAYSVTVEGGGVSFQTGDGYSSLGSVFEFFFKEGSTGEWRVRGGTVSRWSDNFACDEAPDIYGVLASPDLTGDMAVDNSDLVAFAGYLGDTITREHAWQADFTHSQPSPDAGDTAYFAGRLGSDCAASKAANDHPAAGVYAMNVLNLERADVLELLDLANLTPAQIVAEWDSHGWTYDTAALAVISEGWEPQAVARRNWSGVKHLYR
jgi:hypothetical protein